MLVLIWGAWIAKYSALSLSLGNLSLDNSEWARHGSPAMARYGVTILAHSLKQV